MCVAVLSSTPQKVFLTIIYDSIVSKVKMKNIDCSD